MFKYLVYFVAFGAIWGSLYFFSVGQLFDFENRVLIQVLEK